MGSYILIAVMAIIIQIIPFGADAGQTQVGTASWYGNQFNGRVMANGERFDENKLTCASNTIALGRTVTVRNLGNNLSVAVKVTDTGRFYKHRILDLSKKAAILLDMEKKGFTTVEVTV